MPALQRTVGIPLCFKFCHTGGLATTSMASSAGTTLAITMSLRMALTASHAAHGRTKKHDHGRRQPPSLRRQALTIRGDFSRAWGRPPW